jgi:ABC-2 type transport system permease protein
MSNTLAIFKKELRVYFTTATSYVFIGAFAIICAYFFLVLVSQFAQISTQYMSMQAQQMLERLNFNDMVIAPLFSNVQIFLLIMVPMISMRLIAEEKRSKTMQLLMTTPVRPIEIVLGKYLAAAVVVFAMLGVTLAFPLILHFYGTGDGGKSSLDWASVGTLYLGTFLLATSFLAIGLFTSSVTESQIVAVVLSFAIGLMLWVIGWWGMGKEGLAADLTGYLGLINHWEGFARGLLRVQDVVYYLSVTAFGLFLTHRFVEAERWN